MTISLRPQPNELGAVSQDSPQTPSKPDGVDPAILTTSQASFMRGVPYSKTPNAAVARTENASLGRLIILERLAVRRNLVLWHAV